MTMEIRDTNSGVCSTKSHTGSQLIAKVMRKTSLFSVSSVFTGVTACLLTNSLYAATPDADAKGASDSSPVALEEIVVTARRKYELLEDVPQAVNVVTGDAIQKLNITQFADLQNIVPGLSLKQDGSGTQSAASIRGVTFDANTKAPPTVAMYLDDVSVQSLYLFSSLYDVRQVEVLRGPQGTTRGVAAPSGAISVTTHKPDLNEFGGYVSGTFTDQHANNGQAALNLPIIKDVFGIRVAGMYDDSENNGVRSLHNSKRPSQEAVAGRVTASFKPSYDFGVVVSYSHLEKHQHAYDQVSGPGQGTSINPAISPNQRLAVEDGISNIITRQDFVTAQIDALLLGQHLTYTGSYQDSYIYSGLIADQGNILPGIELPYVIPSGKYQTTQELRLASEPSPDRLVDYVAGFYYDSANVFGQLRNQGPLLPGAFGSPANGVDLASFNARYQIPLRVDFPYQLEETSLFGTLTFHLGPQTELSAGLRHIWSRTKDHTTISTQDGLIALPPAFIGPGLPNCAVASLASTYPGFCDVTIPGSVVTDSLYSRHEQPTIYNVSLSHHFSDDLMIYANTGTSFRPAVSSIGIQGALATTSDPRLSTLSVHPSEHSTSYEVGFKSRVLEDRGYVNAALFYQKFKDMTIYVPNILYSDTSTGFPTLFNFTASVDSKIKGFDVDAGYKFSRDLNASVQFNYADGKVDGSMIPCNTVANGAPVFNTAGLISLCPGDSVSREPIWNATLQSEYSHPITSSMAGFVRGLLNYYPKNKNRVEPDFTVDAYSLVNLYAGLRSSDGAWEISAFARNAFNSTRTLDTSPVAYNLNTSLGLSFPQLIPPNGSGYYATSVTPKREVGISLRYAFGSR